MNATPSSKLSVPGKVGLDPEEALTLPIDVDGRRVTHTISPCWRDLCALKFTSASSGRPSPYTHNAAFVRYPLSLILSLLLCATAP
jgi:hypothetical protein